MSALAKIQAAGFRVFLKDENLGITPFDILTESQRNFLKLHKKDIVKELQQQVEWAEPKHTVLMVTCWTPNGNPLEVEARSPEHAEFLQRMNPRPIIH